MGLQHTADNSRPERRVVHIGIANDVDKIQFIPAALFHVIPADRKKFSHHARTSTLLLIISSKELI